MKRILSTDIDRNGIYTCQLSDFLNDLDKRMLWDLPVRHKVSDKLFLLKSIRRVFEPFRKFDAWLIVDEVRRKEN